MEGESTFVQNGLDAEKILQETATRTIDRIRKRLEVFCERELKDDPGGANRVVGIEVCEGYPAEEILRKADELDCDVIVLGTHGKGVLGHTFLGSVAERVVGHSKHAVLIAGSVTERVV